MFVRMLAMLCIATSAGQPPQQTQPASAPAEARATSRPAESPGALRKPTQANILKGLLRQAERPEPIKPAEAAKAHSVTVGPDGQPLLLEGTMLVERRGRLIHEEGRAKFVVHADAESQAQRIFEVLPSQLLEAMEREEKAGYSEFIVTAEVTRYQDRNFIMLRKMLRRVGHGNLGP